MSAPAVLVLQHVAVERAARIVTALESGAGAAIRTVAVYGGEPVPRSLDGIDALVVMGGPMGVYEADRHPFLHDERRLIELAIASSVPTLGICLGSQLVASALGAPVAPGPAKEIGWYEVSTRDAATQDPLFAGAPRGFTALHWHGDVFAPPAGAVSLARSARTEHQAFRWGDSTWGLLFHLEVDPAQVEAMVATFSDELAAAGIDPAAILDPAPRHLAALESLAASVFGSFARRVVAHHGRRREGR